MPLNLKVLDSVPESFKLSDKTAITAFIWGTIFVITPCPQLIICSSSTFYLLASAYISPLCGILAMLFILLKDNGKEALTVSKLNFRECLKILCFTLGIILCSGIVNLIWKICLDFFAISYSKEQYLLTLAKTCSATEFLILSVLVTLIVPVAEELLFRRILFAGLLQFGNKTAWLTTAGVFAAVHLFLAGFPGLFVIGLGFQWLCCRYKNLAASILSHGLLNGFAVLAALLSRGV